MVIIERALFATWRAMRAAVTTATVLVLSGLALGPMGCAARVPAALLVPSKLFSSPPMEAFTIEIEDGAQAIGRMGSSEIDDQLRDWAVYGALVRRGYSPEAIAKATFRASPLRLAYLDEMFLFDHGRGRRAVVGDKDVLLFVDVDDPDPIATLGRMADKVRMEIGETPEALSIYRIRASAGRGEIHVERMQDIPGAAMFSEAFGYVERVVVSLEDLSDWLERVDDLTYVSYYRWSSISGKHDDRRSELTLGGRRFAKSRTKNVTLEQVAALYQAAEKASPGFSLDQHWLRAPSERAFNDLASDPCALLDEANAIVKKGLEQDLPDDAKPGSLMAAEAVVQWQRAIEWRNGGLKRVCGASQRRYKDRLADLGAALAASQQASLLDEQMAGYFQLRSALQGRGSDAALLLAELALVEAKQRVVCARYDGPLEGTSAGMNLFYTDFLAKLWRGVDLYHSAPSLSLRGFLSIPRIQDDAYKEEKEELNHSRFWFAPRREEYSRSPESDKMWFAHIATSAYVAGHNPSNPGVEDVPHDSSRRSVAWWKRHFEEVADYEQQFHVLNQLMKWSLMIPELRARLTLRVLDQVPVHRSQRFDGWLARNQSSLRFGHPISLLPRGESPNGTECFATLESYQGGPGGRWSGGVSLVPPRRNSVPICRAKRPLPALLWVRV